jgi:microcystin-dependent protein
MIQSPLNPARLRMSALLSGPAWMTAFLTLLLGIASVAGLAQNGFPPSLMSYQGFLVDANGNALAPTTPQNYSVVFRIYDASSAGNRVWAEAQTVTIDKGNFSVVLGEGGVEGSEARPDLATVFNSNRASDLYLGITVKGVSNAEISPRLRLLTSPYAFLARTANSLAGSDGAALINSTEGRLRIGQALQTTGGNARGANAVDLQTARLGTAPGQVASGETSVIAGGQNNTSSGRLAVVSGGGNNTASGQGAQVGGGENNTASGQYATIPGGQNNVASGNYSFAVGRRARASHAGSVVFGDNTDVDKNSSGDNQFLIQATGGVGVNSAPAAGAALTVSGRVKAGSLEVDSMNVATLTATSVSGFGTVPLGGIIMWSGAETAVPTGWALCNGQTSNGRATPDLRGRFVVGSGQGPGLSNRAVGATGGTETVTLTESQLPAHNHTFSGTTGGGGEHSHRYFDAHFAECCPNDRLFGSDEGGDNDNSAKGQDRTTQPAGNHSHSFSGTTSTVGSGSAINNLPPFYAMAFIMRVQ